LGQGHSKQRNKLWPLACNKVFDQGDPMRTLLQDLRYAFRQLRNAPAFAFATILTLALGIGANAAMFTVVEHVLLHSLPFPRANEVVQLAVRTESGDFGPTSLPDVLDWQARAHSFQHLGYFSIQVPTLGGAGVDPKIVPQVVASANLFDLLQARPILGRAFLPGDDQPGRTFVVVLSNSVWHELYHSDPHILGRIVPINGLPYTVIGVMPSGFTFPVSVGDDSIWTPVPVQDKSLQARDSASLTVIGRLGSGATLSSATREMNGIHQQLVHEHPKEEDPNPIQMQTYSDVVTGSIRPAILALDMAVIAVWLIACANVAGLLLARGNGRRREVALRNALGAPRSRLIRQFLTESLLLAFAGGALGLGLAGVALRMLEHFLANSLIYGDQIHIDAKVGLFLFVASCLSAVVFGLLPALHVSSVPAQEGLRQSSAGAGISRSQTFWRDGLVVGEIALTLTLLVAAGITIQTLLTLRHTHTGFVAAQVTTGEIYPPSHSAIFSSTASNNLIQSFYTPLLDRLKSSPGIQAVGLTTVRPLQASWNFSDDIEFEGKPKPDKAAHADAQVRATSAGYFSTLGIRLLQGRFFSTTDTVSAPPVAIVNRAFVRRFLPKENPIGQRVRFNEKGDRQWSTIVGVVDDSPEKTLGQPPDPELHFNLAQLLPGDDLYPFLGGFLMNVAVLSPLSTDTVTAEIRHAVHDLQPDAALNGVQSLQQVVDDSLGNEVLAERLLSLLAFTGLGIAIVGIYGLLAYSVSQRTRELGVRLALGAQRGAVLWLVLRQALILLGLGIASGAAITMISSRFAASVLVFKLSGQDALVFLSVAAVLALCGLAASYLPARRAALIDPVIALRSE
jgi:predicted permease